MTEQLPPSRPVPVADEQSEGFWTAAANHQLTVQRCEDCSWLSYPPDVICARCLAPRPRFTWQAVSGRGRLRTWTVVRTAFLPGFGSEVPYVVAEAELEEQPGLLMTARLDGHSEQGLAPGLPVVAAFEDLAERTSIPVFRLAPS